MELKSSAFSDGGDIPAKYTCDGENVSPPLSWNGVPQETESLVLICDDPDAPKGTWSHWVLYNIPPDRTELPEGISSGEELSLGALQGENDFGNIEYGGPCPPEGPAHRYHFRLYALNNGLDLPAGSKREDVLESLQNDIITKTELIGRYARK